MNLFSGSGAGTAAGAASGAAGASGGAAGLISAGSALLGAIGTGQQAVGEAQAGAQVAAVDTYNAQVATIRGQQALDQANAQASIDATAAARRLGAIKADYGAAGVVSTTGSPLSVMMDQAMQGELARQLDLYRGATAAQSEQQQAALDTAQASIARQAGMTRATGTLLTGVARTLQTPAFANLFNGGSTKPATNSAGTPNPT